MYKSKVDGKELKSLKSLLAYEGQRGITKEEVIQDLYFDGQPQYCQCGCGTRMMYNSRTKTLSTFAKGHFARTDGNPTKGMTKEEGREHMKKTHARRQELIDAGEFTTWNKGLGKETDERVRAYGEKQIGKVRTDEEKQKMSVGRKEFFKQLKEDGLYESFHESNKEQRQNAWTPEMRKAAADRAMERLDKMQWETSQFELDMENCIVESKFNYKSQFRISTKEYNKVYDFLVEGKILIEADGDFLHCNPKQFPNGPTYDIQFHHIKNDEIKNKLAAEKGYKLIRIWYSEFYKDKTIVLNKIKEALK